MCGIAGLFNFKTDRAADGALVARMNDALTHRGPDESGVHADGAAAIANRRLSIIDIKGGHQPMSSADGVIWVAYNGEIYNFLDLRAELEAKGRVFRTHSDTETLIHLYAEYGENFSEKLNGMFAFSLWDARKRRLILGRDRFGIKPLLYAETEDGIAWASEIPALLIHPRVRREIDADAMQIYLGYYYIPSPRTIFKQIRRLEPGHLIICEPGRMRLQRYWKAEYAVDSSLDLPTACARFRDLLFDSVRLQLQSEVPYGVFLSGGLDSTSLVAGMARHVEGKVKTFSIGFDEESYSELSDAASVARHYGTEHHEYKLRADEVPEIAEQVIGKLGEPQGDWSAIVNFKVAQMAKQHVTVVLRGDGGDELFGGYPTYSAQTLLRRYRALPCFVRSSIENLVRLLPVSERKMSFEFKARSFLRGANADSWRAHYLWKEIFTAADRAALLSGAGIASPFDPASLYEFHSNDLPPDTHWLNRLLHADMRVFLEGNGFMVSDITSMAHSVETRVPFLDNRLFDFAQSLPPSFKVDGMKTKVIMREAMRGLLPAEIVRGVKRGFVIPGAPWIRGPLREYITGLVAAPAWKNCPWINGDASQRFLNEHLSGQADHTRRLSCLANLQLWFRKFL